MSSWFMWPVTAASIVGTVANVHRRRWCFYVWAGTNAAWCAYDIALGAWPQAALMAKYFILSLVGLWRWRTAK